MSRFGKLISSRRAAALKRRHSGHMPFEASSAPFAPQTIYGKLWQLMQLPFYDRFNVVALSLYRLKAILLYRHIFASFGKRSYIEKPEFIANPRFMHIGDDVSIRKGARLECVLDSYGRVPYVSIGANVNIEQDVHLVCHSRIIIGNNVSITGRCAIVDVTHPHWISDGNKIGNLILNEDSFIEIGDGAFLGFASVILPNVRIGKCAVVGANSVVTRDVPDYAVVAGAPAKIIKSRAPQSTEPPMDD